MLGLPSPTVRGKCLVQEAWQEKESWDTSLCDMYAQEWEKLKEDYILSTRISILHRFYVYIDENGTNAIQLHVLYDASAKAYGLLHIMWQEHNTG